jgi:hypothetical protein
LDSRAIHVPVALLLAPDPTPHDKVISMALRLHPGAGPAMVETATGLSRHTVLNGLARMPGSPAKTIGPGSKCRPPSWPTAASAPGPR